MGIRTFIQRARALSNCIVWAFLMKRRLQRKGFRVYSMKRKSDWGNFSHRLVGIDRDGKVRIVSYKPIDPVKRRFPPPWFRGAVRWGDKVSKPMEML